MNPGTIGIVGFGNLGTAVYQAFNSAHVAMLVNNGSMERTITKLQQQEIPVSYAATLEEIAQKCKVIFLCIKEPQLAVIAKELNMFLQPEHIVVSCLAMVSLVQITRFFSVSDPFVIKIMPTLGIYNGQGLLAYQLPHFPSYPMTSRVFEVLELLTPYMYELKTEEQMQLFTVTVACMPGIIAHFINQFSWRLVKQQPDDFDWYPCTIPQQLRSIADLIEQAGSPLKLWEQVATTGGVTRAMTDVLGKGGLSSLVQQAIVAGMNRMQDEQ